MQAEFKSSDLGRVIRIWQKNLKYLNERLTIKPKGSGGFWDILSPFQQAYAEVVATVDGAPRSNHPPRPAVAIAAECVEQGRAVAARLRRRDGWARIARRAHDHGDEAGEHR